jgi:ribonuclease T2
MFQEQSAEEALLKSGQKVEGNADDRRGPRDRCRTCHTCLTNKYTIGVLVLLASLAAVGIVLELEVFSSDEDDSNDSSEVCYLYPACTTAVPPHADGFTNSTGYTYADENVDANTCCEVCLPGTNATVCFDPEGTCQEKTGDGDYDFLLLDELWIPQFCRALSNAYDPTLSHVEGMQCESETAVLSVHGLWPNYVDGYPQCCNASGLLKPLDPAVVFEWDIYPQLQQEWYDPTQSSECSVCYLLNHEWEKHGGCFSPGDPLTYFSTGLEIHNGLEDIDAVINSFSGQIVNTSSIELLYEMKPNIICDPNDPKAAEYLEQGIGILLEVQTCWSRALQQIDCPAAFQGAFTYACPSLVLLNDVSSSSII